MKTLREIMTRNVVCVSPETPLHEVAAKMKELDTGALPVCDRNRLAGMITDRDIVVKILATGRNLLTSTAADAMSSPVIYCFENQSADEAVRVMEAKQIRRLLVLDEKKKLVGIASLGDFSTRAGSEDLTYELLESVSLPATEAA